MPYSLYLFDYDGTLCDTRRAINFSFQQTFAFFHIAAPAGPLVVEAVNRGLALGDIFRELRPALSAAEVTEWVARYRIIYAAEAGPLVVPFPGALALISGLARQGRSIVVLSNKGVTILEASLAQLGLLPFVALVVGDGSLPEKRLAMKPSPMVFHEVIAPRFPQVKLSEILMVGDTLADLQFANNCRIDSCWVTFGFGDAAQCQALHPTHSVHSLAAIEGLTPLQTTS